MTGNDDQVIYSDDYTKLFTYQSRQFTAGDLSLKAINGVQWNAALPAAAAAVDGHRAVRRGVVGRGCLAVVVGAAVPGAGAGGVRADGEGPRRWSDRNRRSSGWRGTSGTPSPERCWD